MLNFRLFSFQIISLALKIFTFCLSITIFIEDCCSAVVFSQWSRKEMLWLLFFNLWLLNCRGTWTTAVDSAVPRTFRGSHRNVKILHQTWLAAYSIWLHYILVTGIMNVYKTELLVVTRSKIQGGRQKYAVGFQSYWKPYSIQKVHTPFSSLELWLFRNKINFFLFPVYSLFFHWYQFLGYTHLLLVGYDHRYIFCP